MTMKIQHRLLLVAVALVTICMIAATASAEDDVNSLRIYGEDGLSAAFPYTDPEAPFDPMNIESPVKDFVTFNPALIEDDAIFVDGIDSKQKVFATQWFVPEYTEPTGMVWLDDVDGEWIPDHNEYVWEDVVTEYTYMFVDKHYQPTEATATSPSGAYWTKFWFPISDMDDTQTGLDSYDMNYDGVTDVSDMVYLRNVGDFNGDGLKDIAIMSGVITVADGDKLQFLDHIIELKGVFYDGTENIATVKVYYNGNAEPENLGEYDINPGDDTLCAGRHTIRYGTPDFYESWVIQIVSADEDGARIRVGRQIYTAETFFVDGAEYDVAMIYGSEDDNVKYITIRNPVPEHQDVEINDLSIVKEMVDNEEYLPLLPPFNMVHTMVDDINIPHTESCCADTGYVGSTENSAAADGEWYQDDCILAAYDTVEERKIYDVDPLLIYFIDKDDESRFHTNLLEMLDEGADLSNIASDEAWKWLHIRTMPEFYKEFVYPELPDIDDGTGDFLLTSSFRAENSELCEDYDEYVCDPGNVVWPQRLMFVYDQETGTEDIYVNEIDTETNGLRVYGEGDIGAAFPYTDPEAAFDPLNSEAPQKDFVTLNPAKIKAGIVVDNKDSHEKVFFRQWFVPEYTEPTGMVWLDEVYGTYVDKHNHYVWEDVVNEFTYMFIDKHYQPTAGMVSSEGNPDNVGDFLSQDNALWTYFWFPVSDMDDTQIGLDSMDMNYDGDDDFTYLLGVSDFNGDGMKDIAIGSETFTVEPGERLQFLDHVVEVKGVYYDGTENLVTVEVFYNGNEELESLGEYDLNVGDNILSAGRHTIRLDLPDFYEPWAMYIKAADEDGARIRVGRLVHTAETFFVDGAEYDVAMIYGPEDDNVKYITIRNPLPEHQDVEINDLSIVKRAVYDGDIIPVLPPFNGEHIMIDDIDVLHYISGGEDTTCYYGQYLDSSETDDLLWYHDMYINGAYDTMAERMFDVPATEIYFTGKDYEDRFHTNLLEILRECDTTETWKWLHIYTMPDFYKEFVYPDVPNAGGEGDYLLTSSITAPNSVFCDGDGSDGAQKVDLFLLVDGSGSISATDFMTQKTGIANSITNSAIIPQDGSVSICVIQFGDVAHLEVPLTTITSQTDANNVASQVMAMVQDSGLTNMPDAINMATANLPADLSGKQVIDLSTDGGPQDPSGTIAARDNAIAAGFEEINTLGIGFADETFLRSLVEPQPSDDYPGAYTYAADFNEFEAVMAEKLVSEIQPSYQRLMFTYDPLDGTGIYMNGGAPVAEPEEPVDEQMKGDSEPDGDIDIIDFAAFAAAYDSAVGDGNYDVIFDFNDDEVINIIDFAMFAAAYEA